MDLPVNTTAKESCVKILQLYKAKEALDEIVRAYIRRETKNNPTYGSWYTEEGLHLDHGLNSQPSFVSWDSLEIWAAKYFAEEAEYEEIA